MPIRLAFHELVTGKDIERMNYVPKNDYHQLIPTCKRVRSRITLPFVKMTIGKLPNITTSNDEINSIIKTGVKLDLPYVEIKDDTPSKYLNHVEVLLEAGVLEKIPSDATKPKMLFKVFSVSIDTSSIQRS